MNKPKLNKIWRLLIIFGVMLSISASLYIGFSIKNVSKNYEDELDEQIVALKSKIKTDLSTGNYKDLKNLVENNAIELNIKNSGNKAIFSSISEKSQKEIKNKLNKNAVNYETTYTIETHNGEHEVWLLVYNSMPQSVFDYIIKNMIVATLIILIVILILILILYYKFLYPLHDLNDNIKKLSKFKLDEMTNRKGNSEYDELNKDIYNFGRDLDVIIQETGSKYTELTKDIEITDEKLNHQNRLVASLAHNLKAPIITIKHMIIKEGLNNDNNIIDKIDNIIIEINDISRIVFQDNKDEILNISQFDLVELLLDIYDEYDIRFKERNMVVEFNIDEKIFINDYRLQYKQLIHNAMSNIVNYGYDNAYVKISCYIEDELLTLSFYNDSEKFSDEQIESIFKLFYRVSNNNEGMGTGLYIVKTIADYLEGDVEFKNYDEGVLLEFRKSGVVNED